ncbi:sensor histidine kinase [Paenibacillus sp. J2TS4]|uniref:cache domain-containing sensor histidine kinase n=1 Tax=Paenibacillus sp. J2TS4 TaxID=2807194 RepID=UPI001B071DC5|nr:histidine kinase [Paenibacillus sp. J2TS4]GIP34986.1 sensor histidine kinase YesM [Paenibacillus sp. J2TS4]
MFKIRQSLRNKLIVFLLAATIVPIVTSIIITYQYTKETVAQESVVTSANLLFQGKTNLLHYLDIVRKASFALDNDAIIRDMFNYPRSLDDYSSFMDEREIFRFLQSVSHTVPEIHQVYLYFQKRGDAYAAINDNFRRNRKAAAPDPPLLPDPVVRVETTHMSSNYHFDNFPYVPQQMVLTLHRTILDAPSTEVLGRISIDIALDTIRAIVERLYNREEELLYVLDEQGAIVYSPDSEQMGKVLKEPWVEHLLSRGEEKGSFSWRDESFAGMNIYEKLETPYFQWTLVKRIPFDVLYQNARQLTAINTLVFIGFLVIVILATLWISFHVTAPIKRLIGYINRIRTGNLQVEIEVKGSDELALLGTRFASMMETINELILREYRLELANKTNELKALQAQINPHFINNAMQSIGTLALQQGQRQIYSLISSLGKMMRYSMNTNQSVVPLSVEVDYVKAYLDLQKQRFGNQLASEFDLEPEVLQTPVPKMILQPLVENYFKHGFDSSLRGQQIRLTGAVTAEETEAEAGAEAEVLAGTGAEAVAGTGTGAEAVAGTGTGAGAGAGAGRMLRLEVSDNGRGMPPSSLAKLKASLERDHSGGALDNETAPSPSAKNGTETGEAAGSVFNDHIGLSNVLLRLKLYYDDLARLEVAANEPQGFKVILWIPLKEEARKDGKQ